jgi:hypothetical protein
MALRPALGRRETDKKRTNMNKNKKTIAAALSALAFAAPAAAYTIDGGLADWGLQSNWSVSPSVRAGTVENASGSGAFYLDPGWGGQAYDAEALYVDWDASNLYLALVTGLSPNTPHNPAGNSYAAGDFLFNFGGDASFEYGLVVKPIAGLQVGGVYRVTELNYGLWAAPQVQGPAPNPYPVAVKRGSLVGTGSLAYPATGFTGMSSKTTDVHYAIEASIPLAAFGDLWNVAADGPRQDLYIWWTAYCANDVIGAEIEAVPEPATALLAGLGLACVVGVGRRKGRR